MKKGELGSPFLCINLKPKQPLRACGAQAENLYQKTTKDIRLDVLCCGKAEGFYGAEKRDLRTHFAPKFLYFKTYRSAKSKQPLRACGAQAENLHQKTTKDIRLDVLCCLWCEKRDLNPYGVNHTPLKRARLPVPPLSLADV